MDFENARWVKLYCQDTGTWLRLGWQGRTLALHLLRAVNASGVLSDLGEEPELILAELMRLPVEVVSPGIAALLRTETITLANGVLVWRKFVEAQKSRKSEAQRKAEYRAKHRAEAIKAQGGTDCPESGTDSPTEGQDRPPVPSDGDKKSQNRREKNRKKRKKRTDKKPSGQGALPLDEPQAAGGSEANTQSTEHIALHLFGELQAARKRCRPSIRFGDKVLPGHTKEIERCLRDGLTPEQVRHVITVWEALVKSGKREMEHFGPLSPFRASNVMQYVEMSLEDARNPRGQAQQVTRPPEPPKSPQPAQSDFERRRKELESSE